MLGRMLKPFLPRSLYWRAALIIFVPVVTILLVVSFAFVQRHYEGVTRQLTANFTLVLRHILDETNRMETGETAAQRAATLGAVFDLNIALPAPEFDEEQGAPPPFYDLTGRLAIRELRGGLEQVENLALHHGEAVIWLSGRHGPVRIEFSLDRVSARNPHQLLVLTGVIGTIMGLISFIYLRNQMRPIRRLAKAAEAFGRGHVLPFSPSGATEVRAAGAEFIEMRARIERHIEQRTMLLSGVSHDLRTPLTRMRLALSMLDDDPEAQALLEDVAEMEMLIDRFLEFSRADAAEPVTQTDIKQLIAERVEGVTRAGADVKLLAGQATPIMVVRPQLFCRAVDNLIGNALRYGSRVVVSVEQRVGELVISVEDDGPGIDPSQYEQAMKPFARLDPARGTARGSGVGLGLAIVADAMRSHGGRLELDRGTRSGYGGLVARLVLPVRS